MKVLQINIKYKYGGAGKIVSNLHNELEYRGFDSYVAFGRGEIQTSDKIFRISKKTEVYIDAAINRIIGLNGYSCVSATGKLIRKIEEIQPDIIHVHGLHGYYINYIKLFNYLASLKIPIVWTFHDTFAFTGKCAYPYDCNKWKNMCYKCPKIKEYPSTLFMDFTKKMWCDKAKSFTKIKNMVIVSPSEWMTELAKESFFGKYNCITIHNGIDTENTFYDRGKGFCKEKYGYSHGDKVILGIADGINEPRKGVIHLVNLAKNFSKNPNVKVILIGWKNKVDSSIINSPNIEVIPFTKDQDQLAEYYSLSDVFVIPSLAENYATVVIESLACGTPVIGFDTGGIPNQLKNGLGAVVPVGNQKALEETILSVIDGRIKLRNREDIIIYTKKNNSIKTMTQAYIDLYNSLIKDGTKKV